MSWLWTAYWFFVLTTAALFFIPAFIIRPFNHQAPRFLLLAMTLRQHAPLGTLLAAATCVLLALALWRASSRGGKAVLALTLLVVAFSATMARLNYFEWMFHPIDGPQFLAQADSKLDAKEMIMAVRLGDNDRAYPIDEMAYHHVLNDVVNGVPIAVTY